MYDDVVRKHKIHVTCRSSYNSSNNNEDDEDEDVNNNNNNNNIEEDIEHKLTRTTMTMNVKA